MKQIICVQCGQSLVVHFGQYREYLRCSGYPQCDITQCLFDGMPIGVQADKPLRTQRKLGHQKFNAVKQHYGMTTQETYAWLAGRLRLSIDLCHFGLFSKELCQEAVHILQDELEEQK